MRSETIGTEVSIGTIPGSLPKPVWAARTRPSAPSFPALAFVFAANGFGEQCPVVEPPPRLHWTALTVDGSAPALAFSKYLTSIQERSPFTESGPISVEIEASLPGSAKKGSLLAVRQTGASERSEYRVVRVDGDPTVKQQVIARYLDAQGQAEALPYSTVAVTPANYKFRYVGRGEAEGSAIYIFQITPRKKRVGMIRGQIWIDAATGIAVHQAGRFVKQPSVFISRIEIVRDTNLQGGVASRRITQVVIDTHLVGRAELTIVERPLQAADLEVAQRVTIDPGSR
jgi:hypothetical protein